MSLGPEYNRALSCSVCKRPYIGNENPKCTYNRYNYHILAEAIAEETAKNVHEVQGVDDEALTQAVEYILFNLIYVKDVIIFFIDHDGNEFVLIENEE